MRRAGLGQVAAITLLVLIAFGASAWEQGPAVLRAVPIGLVLFVLPGFTLVRSVRRASVSDPWLAGVVAVVASLGLLVGTAVAFSITGLRISGEGLLAAMGALTGVGTAVRSTIGVDDRWMDRPAWPRLQLLPVASGIAFTSLVAAAFVVARHGAARQEQRDAVPQLWVTPTDGNRSLQIGVRHAGTSRARYDLELVSGAHPMRLPAFWVSRGQTIVRTVPAVTLVPREKIIVRLRRDGTVVRTASVARSQPTTN